MKFCIPLLIACGLLVSTANITQAAPTNPPVISATATADGTEVTITGSVADEEKSTVQIFIYGGSSTPAIVSVNNDGSFSTTIEVPPFVHSLVVMALDEDGLVDYFTINL